MTADRRSRREWLFDIRGVVFGLMLGLLLMVEAAASGTVVPTRTVEYGVFIGLGCVACLLLWWRRPAPLAIAATTMVLGLVSPFAGAAGLIALFTLAVVRRWQQATAIALVSLLLAVPLAVRYPDPELGVVGTNMLNVLLLAVVLFGGMVIRARRELVLSLRERAVRAESEADLRAERARSLERERIAREMHDVLAHRISLVSLHAGALEVRRDLSAEEVAGAAATIRASAYQAMRDLRELLGVLRAGDGDPGLRPPPSLAELGDLVAENRTAGIRVEFTDRLPDGFEPAASVQRTAYRVVQEGLTNSRRHAPGARVCILVERLGADLHVRLRSMLEERRPPTTGDDAVPVVDPAGSGTGLVGLTERVELVGGRIDHGIRRVDNADLVFDLEVWLPCSN
ncbi:sensor histidine kinase [Actinoalloteichus hymeniacidonis]|uniref:histidine kinase n=1 Tax=Actinoalloteichus hymeniacidonis TaxID=340345 RepID=A0AAC9HRF9_9PSEU|nr:histidine kinase [Actinoalloteichus hymeniacidonis]AOS63851.1 signal transduction histidine kinase [Actinoalloteichus hymeniacidonis]MBB5908093.1 signal transduction histidine kinase [Actinoalloteichus hymeniacidonis]